MEEKIFDALHTQRKRDKKKTNGKSCKCFDRRHIHEEIHEGIGSELSKSYLTTVYQAILIGFIRNDVRSTQQH